MCTLKCGKGWSGCSLVKPAVLPGWRQGEALRLGSPWDAQEGGYWREGGQGKEGRNARGQGAKCQPEADFARAEDGFCPFLHLHTCSRSAVSNTGFLTATASAHVPFQVFHSVRIYVIRKYRTFY